MNTSERPNEDIRKKMRVADVRQWQVAAHLGVTSWTFYGWLRGELPKERRKAILQAIKELQQASKTA